MKQKQLGSVTLIIADSGYIHRLGTDTYVKSVVMLPDESADDYEEVAERPAYTKAEYDAKVAEMVRERYSESEEFALQRKMLNAMLNPEPMTLEKDGEAQEPKAVSEYREYNEYVERCKVDAPAAIAEARERQALEEAEAERLRAEEEARQEQERQEREEAERLEAERIKAEAEKWEAEDIQTIP